MRYTSVLIVLVAVMIAISVVIPNQAHSTFAQANPTATQTVSENILARINNLRASLALPPYRLNDRLSVAAQDQANWMVATGIVSHTRPDGNTPATRCQAAGYANSWSCGEIIYMGGIATVDYAWDFWTTSSIHYAMLTHIRYQEIGIGTAHSDSAGQSFVVEFGIAGGGATILPTLVPTQPTESTPATPEATSPTTLATPQEINTPSATPSDTPQPSITPIPTQRIHVVQPGENLFRIALRYGVPLDKLAAANGIQNVARIQVGQTLIIPDP